MVRIAVAGKGGVGKTLIAAGFSRVFAGSGRKTIAIDADPSPNLGSMLGLSSRDCEAIVPISRNEELIRAKTVTNFPGVFTLNFSVEDIIRDYTVPTPAGAHLLVLGTIARMGAGCSCPANAVLRNVLHRLVTGNDEAVVLDMEAGVEHLGRGTAKNVDILLVVTTADSRSLATAGSIIRIAKDAGIPQVMIAGNRVRDSRDEGFISSLAHDHGIPVLGFVPLDQAVADGGIAGNSILQLTDAAAFEAITAMAGKILLECDGKKLRCERDLP